MTALGWLALALAVLLAPVSSPVRARAEALAARGRLRVASRAPSAALPVRPEVVATAGGVVASLAVAVTGGLVLALATAVAMATVAHVGFRAMRVRTGRRREAQLLTAVRVIAAELDAGSQPAAALDAAAEAAPPYRDVFAEAAVACRRGTDPDLSAGELVGLGHAWHMAAVTGAPLAGVVGRVAGDLSARGDQRRAVGAAVAGARSSAYLLAGLPVLGLLLGTAMDADPVHVLLGTPSGRLLCLVGVVLDCAGVLWTGRLTARAAPP